MKHTTIVSWNVNGARAIAQKGLSQTASDLKADILCLQEVKASAEQFESVRASHLSNLETLSMATADKPGYSGVATLARSGSFAHKASWNELGIPEFEQEGRFAVSDVNGFLLYNIYLPSGTTGEVRQSKKYLCLDLFFEHLQSLSKSDRERLIICGDFNICHRPIDIHHPETAERRKLSGFLPEERVWMERLAELQLSDSFRALHPGTSGIYSWWTYRAGAREKNLGWRIDYIFVGKKILPRLKNAEIHTEIMGSDHCPISICLAGS